MVFSKLRMVIMPRNLVEILIKNSAFCLNYLCPTQCIDYSLMRVFMSLDQKNLISLLEMRSCNELIKNAKIGHFQCLSAP